MSSQHNSQLEAQALLQALQGQMAAGGQLHDPTTQSLLASLQVSLQQLSAQGGPALAGAVPGQTPVSSSAVDLGGTGDTGADRTAGHVPLGAPCTAVGGMPAICQGC